MPDDLESIFLLANTLPESAWIQNSLYYVFIVVLLLFLLVASALVSACEVALFSLRPHEINLCRRSNKRVDKCLINFLDHSERFLAIILILNNLFNLSFVTLATFTTWTIFDKEHVSAQIITILTAVVTLCIVLFGEIVPKVYAQQHALRYIRLVVKPLHYIGIILRPITGIFIFIHKHMKRYVYHTGYSYSRHSLQEAIDLTRKHESFSSEEEEGMLRGIMNFASIPTKEIMRPRHDMIGIEANKSFHALLSAIEESRHSRIPIYSETLDKIKGMLYTKDLVPHIDQKDNFNWHTLLRSAYYVPENRKIGSLFKDFQKKHIHIAIVVDEYGGTSGLVTMEDVIEEIVGDIRDESDTENTLSYKKLDAHTFIFEAKISLNDLCKVLDLEQDFFDKSRNESQSLAGLMLEINEKMPQIGDKITYEHLIFKVLSADHKRIKRVRVSFNPTQKVVKEE